MFVTLYSQSVHTFVLLHKCFHMLLLVLYQVLLLIAFVRLRSPFFYPIESLYPSDPLFYPFEIQIKKNVILVIVKMSSSYL